MPKLSQKSLEKRLTCPYCGISLRTRQGLSGHIQFLHQTLPIGNQNPQGVVQPAPQPTSGSSYTDELLILKKRMDLWKARKNDFRPREIEQGNDIFRRWFVLKNYFNTIDIKLTDDDFKNFFIQNFGISNSMSNQEMQAVLKSLELVESSIALSTKK